MSGRPRCSSRSRSPRARPSRPARDERPRSRGGAGAGRRGPRLGEESRPQEAPRGGRDAYGSRDARDAYSDRDARGGRGDRGGYGHDDRGRDAGDAYDGRGAYGARGGARGDTRDGYDSRRGRGACDARGERDGRGGYGAREDRGGSADRGGYGGRDDSGGGRDAYDGRGAHGDRAGQHARGHRGARDAYDAHSEPRGREAFDAPAGRGARGAYEAPGSGGEAPRGRAAHAGRRGGAGDGAAPAAPDARQPYDAFGPRDPETNLPREECAASGAADASSDEAEGPAAATEVQPQRREKKRRKKERRSSSSSSSSSSGLSDWRQEVWERGFQGAMGAMWPPVAGAGVMGGPFWPWQQQQPFMDGSAGFGAPGGMPGGGFPGAGYPGAGYPGAGAGQQWLPPPPPPPPGPGREDDGRGYGKGCGKGYGKGGKGFGKGCGKGYGKGFGKGGKGKGGYDGGYSSLDGYRRDDRQEWSSFGADQVQQLDHRARSRSRSRSQEALEDIPVFLEPSVEEFVPVPKALLGKVIGKQAQTIIDIRHKSGAFKVDARDQTSDPCQVKVCGTADAVKRARELIMEVLESTKTKHEGSEYVEVPRAKIGMLIGLKGAQVNEIQQDTNTKIDVDFSHDPCRCYIKGLPDNVQAAKRVLLTIAMQIEDENSEYIDLPKASAGALIGTQGFRVREFQQTSGCRIDVDKTGNTCRVRLTGTPGQVEFAKQLIHAEVDKAAQAAQKAALAQKQLAATAAFGPLAADEDMIVPAHQPTTFPATLSESIARAKAAAEAVKAGIISTEVPPGGTGPPEW